MRGRVPRARVACHGSAGAGTVSPFAMTVFDPFSAAPVEDPYPQYARLRVENPVHWSAKLRAWILFRWEDVTAALRDEARFSSDRMNASRGESGAAAPIDRPIRTVSSDPPA